jgi:GTPase SAR1 family protein
MKQLGSRWSATFPINVGALLSRRERHSVCLPALSLTVVTDHASYIVDSADRDALPVAKEELHILLEKQAMEGIPLLVLGNKSDLSGHMNVDELIEALDLKRVTHREVSCYGISAKEETNLDAVLQWLIARAGSKSSH